MDTRLTVKGPRESFVAKKRHIYQKGGRGVENMGILIYFSFIPEAIEFLSVHNGPGVSQNGVSEGLINVFKSLPDKEKQNILKKLSKNKGDREAVSHLKYLSVLVQFFEGLFSVQSPSLSVMTLSFMVYGITLSQYY